MSTIKVDARGLACPQPVIATKRALDGISEGRVVVVVDNAVAKENIVKFAGNGGFGVSVEQTDGIFSLTLVKGAAVDGAQDEGAAKNEQGGVYLLTSEFLGRGDDQLGAILMKSFFVSLQELPPKKIFLLNSAVKLAVAGSPVQEELRLLQQQGAEVWACGTCLDFFGVKEQLAIGAATNMFAILQGVNNAERAITL